MHICIVKRLETTFVLFVVNLNLFYRVTIVKIAKNKVQQAGVQFVAWLLLAKPPMARLQYPL